LISVLYHYNTLTTINLHSGDVSNMINQSSSQAALPQGLYLFKEATQFDSHKH